MSNTITSSLQFWAYEHIRTSGWKPEAIIEALDNVKSILKSDYNITEPRDYQKAYDILMSYWDYIPEYQKDTVNERLKEVGL